MITVIGIWSLFRALYSPFFLWWRDKGYVTRSSACVTQAWRWSTRPLSAWREHKHCDISSVDLITEMATEGLTGRGHIQQGDAGHGWFSSRVGRSRTAWDFITLLRMGYYELSISGIFHLTCSDCGWLQVTEPAESDAADKGDGLLLLQMPWEK